MSNYWLKTLVNWNQQSFVLFLECLTAFLQVLGECLYYSLCCMNCNSLKYFEIWFLLLMVILDLCICICILYPVTFKYEILPYSICPLVSQGCKPRFHQEAYWRRHYLTSHTNSKLFSSYGTNMILLFEYTFRPSYNCTCDSHHIQFTERLLNPSRAFSLHLSSPMFNQICNLKMDAQTIEDFLLFFLSFAPCLFNCCFWLQEYRSKTSRSLQLKNYIVNPSCWRVQHCPLSCLPLCVCVFVFQFLVIQFFIVLFLLFWLCIYIWSVAANFTTWCKEVSMTRQLQFAIDWYSTRWFEWSVDFATMKCTFLNFCY